MEGGLRGAGGLFFLLVFKKGGGRGGGGGGGGGGGVGTMAPAASPGLWGAASWPKVSSPLARGAP